MNIALITASLLMIPAVLAAGPPRQTVEASQTAVGQKRLARTSEQIFKVNCSRCHQPPMSLSPRVTGTVIMHMRMRARLSGEDERRLLKYLAP